MLAYLEDMLAEVDSGDGILFDQETPTQRNLEIRVVHVWARIWRGEAIWNVVRMIGEALLRDLRNHAWDWIQSERLFA